MRRLTVIFLLSLFYPLLGHANDGSSPGFRNLPGIYKVHGLVDTLPPAKKPEESAPAPTDEKPVVKIKEVPKSRRQVKPVAVPAVPVTPIKIIKPKIIRRTIGITGL